MRVCSKCQEKKEPSQFNKDRTRPDGLSYHCKSCRLRFERVSRGVDLDRPINNPDHQIDGKFNRKKYYEKNKEYYTFKSMMRRAQKLKATPPWLSDDHKREMRELYREAREKGMHVDHIYPLVHDMCCGLNVPWNLQLLLPIENLKKHNKLPA